MQAGGQRFDPARLHHSTSVAPGITVALLYERKKFIGFRLFGVRDICYCKGKIDPADTPLEHFCVLVYLLQPISVSAFGWATKGSVCKNPTCLIEIFVFVERFMRFSLHMGFKNDQASKGHLGDVLAVRGDERRGTLR